MITAIELENFKGFGSATRIPMRPITLLFGGNSSGKSSIFHALQYAYEILENHNFDADITERGSDKLNLGGYMHMVHNRVLGTDIRLAFDLDLSEQEIPSFDAPPGLELDGLVSIAKVELLIGWDAAEQRPYAKKYSVYVDDIFAAEFDQSTGQKYGTFINYNIDHPLTTKVWDKEYLDQWEEWVPVQAAGLRTAIPEWGRRLQLEVGTGDELLDGGDYVLSQVLVGIGELFLNYLRRLRHIGPIRQVIPRHYEGNRSRSKGGWYDGTAAWDYLLHHSDEWDQKRISAWLEEEEFLNTGYGIKVLEGFNPNQHYLEDLNKNPFFRDILLRRTVRLVSKDTKHHFSLQDVGVGLSQLIPVVIAALLRSTKILCVEQPELHVHPAVQVGLGDLFASQALERDCLFLIETHSEHLVLRLLRRIRQAAEGELPDGAPRITPDDISIVYIENSMDEAKVTSIGIDQEGEFTSRWPHGFFGERAEELFS
ncbi:DUF3696 domain-containing protein [Kordiimonas sp.]|uniref:DUF3696 domain-containing protein n=1 Tax=Kordiimonas sp. TaxID=1970157 RepID=UPI003A91B70D